MAKRVNKKTRKLTFGAVSVALGVVVLAIGSLIEVLDLTFAAFAGMIVIFAVIELGGFWPWMVYAGTGMLSLLLPMKMPAVYYIFIGGWYPIVKEKIEKLRSRVLQWVIKLALMNSAAVITVLLSKYVLMLPEDEIGVTWLFVLMCDAAFVLYDIALTKLISLYIIRLRKRFGFDKYK